MNPSQMGRSMSHMLFCVWQGSRCKLRPAMPQESGGNFMFASLSKFLNVVLMFDTAGGVLKCYFWYISVPVAW